MSDIFFVNEMQLLNFLSWPNTPEDFFCIHGTYFIFQLGEENIENVKLTTKTLPGDWMTTRSV